MFRRTLLLKHAVQIFTTYVQVDFDERRRKDFRSPPALHALRLCPCLPYELARRIEDARNDELSLLDFYGTGLIFHFVRLLTSTSRLAQLVSRMTGLFSLHPLEPDDMGKTSAGILNDKP